LIVKITYLNPFYLVISEREALTRDKNYDVTEVYKISNPPSNHLLLNQQIQFLDDSTNPSSMWAIDGMLIDEELLYAEDEEADRIY
jgi:hypothetical protein